MPALLFLAFLIMPLVELAVIMQVGDVIGVGWTIALLVVDSLAGAVIVRREGRRAWQAFRQAIEAGRWPADEVAQGALVLVGGALLLTPGFVTDVMGLSFVLPPTRALLARLIRSRVRRGAVRVIGFGGPGTGGAGGGSGARGPGAGPRGPGAASSGGDVLDVEVVSVERESERSDRRESERSDRRESERSDRREGDGNERPDDRPTDP